MPEFTQLIDSCWSEGAVTSELHAKAIYHFLRTLTNRSEIDNKTIDQHVGHFGKCVDSYVVDCTTGKYGKLTANDATGLRFYHILAKPLAHMLPVPGHYGGHPQSVMQPLYTQINKNDDNISITLVLLETLEQASKTPAYPVVLLLMEYHAVLEIMSHNDKTNKQSKDANKKIMKGALNRALGYFVHENGDFIYNIMMNGILESVPSVLKNKVIEMVRDITNANDGRIAGDSLVAKGLINAITGVKFIKSSLLFYEIDKVTDDAIGKELKTPPLTNMADFIGSVFADNLCKRLQFHIKIGKKDTVNIGHSAILYELLSKNDESNFCCIISQIIHNQAIGAVVVSQGKHDDFIIVGEVKDYAVASETRQIENNKESLEEHHALATTSSPNLVVSNVHPAEEESVDHRALCDYDVTTKDGQKEIEELHLKLGELKTAEGQLQTDILVPTYTILSYHKQTYDILDSINKNLTEALGHITNVKSYTEYKEKIRTLSTHLKGNVGKLCTPEELFGTDQDNGSLCEKIRIVRYNMQSLIQHLDDHLTVNMRTRFTPDSLLVKDKANIAKEKINGTISHLAPVLEALKASIKTHQDAIEDISQKIKELNVQSDHCKVAQKNAEDEIGRISTQKELLEEKIRIANQAKEASARGEPRITEPMVTAESHNSANTELAVTVESHENMMDGKDSVSLPETQKQTSPQDKHSPNKFLYFILLVTSTILYYITFTFLDYRPKNLHETDVERVAEGHEYGNSVTAQPIVEPDIPSGSLHATSHSPLLSVNSTSRNYSIT